MKASINWEKGDVLDQLVYAVLGRIDNEGEGIQLDKDSIENVKEVCPSDRETIRALYKSIQARRERMAKLYELYELLNVTPYGGKRIADLVQLISI